jgi:putative transposase
MIEEAIGQLTPIVGTTAALAVVGADRATWYRHHRQSPAPVRPERIATPQPRALTPVERKEIKRTLESDEFVDEAPATVYAKLLDRSLSACTRRTETSSAMRHEGSPTKRSRSSSGAV